MKAAQFALLSLVTACSMSTALLGQIPAPPPRPAFSVTIPGIPDGGEILLRYSALGDNKSPAIEFHWTVSKQEAAPPIALKSYAIILHDVDVAMGRGIGDVLHWSVFNIPATEKGLPEGLASGDLPNGTRNGPGIGTTRGNPPGYYGPAPPAGSMHHYVFEFYALDTMLDLPANATREQLTKAFEGHVIGKAAYLCMIHVPAQK